VKEQTEGDGIKLLTWKSLLKLKIVDESMDFVPYLCYNFTDNIGAGGL
jgi:hypothetical protein